MLDEKNIDVRVVDMPERMRELIRQGAEKIISLPAAETICVGEAASLILDALNQNR